MAIGRAIQQADIIILAVWFNAIKELLNQYSSNFGGKIVIDPSNPIAPDDKGGFKKIIIAEESAGVINNTNLPKGTRLVKAQNQSLFLNLEVLFRSKPSPEESIFGQPLPSSN